MPKVKVAAGRMARPRHESRAVRQESVSIVSQVVYGSVNSE